MRWICDNNREISFNIFRYRIDPARKAPSKGSQYVKEFLLQVSPNDVWTEELRIPRTKLRVDFVNFTKKYAIEFNGGCHHESYVKHFHKNRIGFLKALRRDASKAIHLERNNIQLIEIYDDDLDYLTRDWFQKKFDIMV